MKTIKITLITLVALAITACHRNTRHVVITDGDNNGHSLRIEYYGNVMFTSDETSIKSISPKGSAHYEANDEEILAESDDNGRIIYQVNDGPRARELDRVGRDLLARAVKVMIKRGHYHQDL